jgi:plasmid stabilization system protein ParE
LGGSEGPIAEKIVSLPVVISDEAKVDLNDATSWYEQQREGLGDEFLDCIDEAFDQIRQFPQLSPKVFLDLRRKVVRRFPYLVIYRIDDDQITVVAVYHGKRHPRGWQERAAN